MLIGCGQGSEGRSAAGKAATVKWGSAASRTAVLDCITAGGAVGVNCGAVGRQQGVGSDGSAVPALGSDSRLNTWSSVYQLVVGL